jgi:hypothetical protein
MTTFQFEAVECGMPQAHSCTVIRGARLFRLTLPLLKAIAHMERLLAAFTYRFLTTALYSWQSVLRGFFTSACQLVADLPQH